MLVRKNHKENPCTELYRAYWGKKESTWKEVCIFQTCVAQGSTAIPFVRAAIIKKYLKTR